MFNDLIKLTIEFEGILGTLKHSPADALRTNTFNATTHFAGY
jgi:hypothetical protein